MHKKPGTGNYTSTTCPGCYATALLNIYPDLKRKMEEITNKFPNIEDFKADIKKIKNTGIRFIRFYSLGDYNSSQEIPYIHAAAQIMPVELFSKTLHSYFRNDIISIMSHSNIHISLSLNKSFSENYTKELHDFLFKNKLLKNVQLNYCFTEGEEERSLPYISVYHTTKKNKLNLFETVGRNRSCCARTKDGTQIHTKQEKGSCLKCPLCKLPAANKQSQIYIPKLLKESYQQC